LISQFQMNTVQSCRVFRSRAARQEQGPIMRRAVNALPVVALLAMLSPASAQVGSCQTDFQKHGSAREAAVKRINEFNRKRPSAQQACAAFSNLSGIEARMLKWMNDNKEWCQIPEEMVAQMQTSSGRTAKIRGQICTAARREAQGQAGAPQGAPPPGAGVRLPQGAL
jgi:hypothetical protein